MAEPAQISPSPQVNWELNIINAHLLDCERDHNEVYSMVEPLKVEWVKLGMKLGVPYAEIEAIDRDKPTQGEKLMKMLSVWLRRGRKDQPIPSWRILHDAVETLDRNIADAIARDWTCYCDDCLGIRPADHCINTDTQHVEQPSRCLSQQQQEHVNNKISTNLSQSGGSAVTTSHSEKSASTHLPDGLIDSVIELSGEYDSMLTHIQTKIEKKVDEKTLNLRQIARYLCRCLNKTYCPLDPNDTLEDILRPITQSMNYIDPNMDLLLKVDREYCDRAHQKRLHEYLQKLSQFRKSTLITNFIAAIKSKRSQMKKSSKKKHSDTKIIIRVGDMYSDAMVDNVLKLKEKIFSNLDVGLVEVHHSILTLVYHIPHDLVTQAITIVKEQKSLLEELGVISVQIADTVIEISAYDDTPLALIAASRSGHEAIVDKLLKAGVDPSQSNKYGNTPLIAASRAGHEAIVDMLLKAGVDPSQSSLMYGDTPLVAASRAGREAIVDMLLKAGVDPSQSSEYGDTPLVAASQGGHDTIVNKLLEGVDPSQSSLKYGDTPLVAASRAGHKVIVDMLLKAGVNPFQSSKYGDTPLIAASRAGNEAIVDKLLKAGVDSSLMYGDKPIIAVSKAGHKAIMERLLKVGVDPSQSSYVYDTPLIAASKAGHKAIVDKLLNAGADPFQSNRFGKSPLSVAKSRGHTAVVERLLKKSNKT